MDNATMTSSLRMAWTVARVDLLRLFKSRDYWGPLLIVGFVFFVAIPAVALMTVTRIEASPLLVQVGEVLDGLTTQLDERAQTLPAQGRTAFALAVFLLAPIAVVVPLTVSSAVGAQSIVGERERGTGEFLAHSPLTVGQIYVGKLIASLLPGYLATLVGFGLYSLVVNVMAGGAVGGWFFPTAGWWALVLWVLPPFLAIAVAIIVRLSAKVRSTAAAQQVASLVSLPVIILAYGIAGGAVLDPTRAAVFIGAIAWVGAIYALVRGRRAFQRDVLLGLGDEA